MAIIFGVFGFSAYTLVMLLQRATPISRRYSATLTGAFTNNKKRVQPAVAPIVKPPTLEAVIHAELDKLADFSPTQTCISRSTNSALAVDNSANQVCLFEYRSEKLFFQVLPARDILSVKVVEDSYLKSESVTTTVTNAKTKTSGTSMVGRAVVGGLLLGPVGAVVGGATAKKKTVGTGKEVTQQTTKEMVRRIDLKLTVNDPSKPLWTFNFLSIEAPKSSSTHRRASDRANQWQALLTVLAQRS